MCLCLLRFFLIHPSGYSLFAVVGEIMDCEADRLLRITPAVQPTPPLFNGGQSTHGSHHSDKSSQEEQVDPELQMALMESQRLIERDDISLQKVLRESMTGL